MLDELMIMVSVPAPKSIVSAAVNVVPMLTESLPEPPVIVLTTAPIPTRVTLPVAAEASIVLVTASTELNVSLPEPVMFKVVACAVVNVSITLVPDSASTVRVSIPAIVMVFALALFRFNVAVSDLKVLNVDLKDVVIVDNMPASY